MKNKVVRALIASLSVSLIMSMTGCQIFGAGKAAGEDTKALVEDARITLEQTNPYFATANADGNLTGETVYILSDSEGKVDKVIKSDEVTLDGEKLYEQKEVNEKPPVDVTVSYYFKGRKVSPESILGQSGDLTIRFDYENNTRQTVTVDGKEEEVIVPFTMMTGLILDNETFRNVSAVNAKIVDDGSRSIVVGYAFPGLQEGLDLSEDVFKIPEYVEVKADVVDFKMTSSITLASNDLLREKNEEGREKIDTLEKDLNDDLEKLTDAILKLEDGSGQLCDGLTTLNDKSTSLSDGVGKLADGAGALSAGTIELQNGAGSLSDGIGSLQNGSAALQNGAGALKDGMASLQSGAGSLKAGAGSLQEGAAKLQTGAGTLCEGAASLSDGAAALYDGTVKIQTGAASLEDGLKQLSSNNDQLNNGATAIFNSLLSQTGAALKDAGIGDVNLTIENYDEVLEGIIKSLDPDNAYATAKAKVEAAVDAMGDNLYLAYLKQNEDALYTQAVASQITDEMVYEKMKELSGQEEEPAKNDEEVNSEDKNNDSDTSKDSEGDKNVDKENGVDTGKDSEGENKAGEEKDTGASKDMDGDSDTENKENDSEEDSNDSGTPGFDEVKAAMIRAGVEALTDEQKSAILNGALSSLSEEQKSAIKTAAIEQQMNSDEVRSALEKASAGAAQIAALKGQLDSYKAFYNGLLSYTSGVSLIYKGATELKGGTDSLVSGSAAVKDGSANLKAGADSLKGGIDQLKAGTDSLKGGTDSLKTGVDKLCDGSAALKAGTDSLKSGADRLAGGAGQLKGGISRLSGGANDLHNGLNTLKDGIPALIDGIGRLKDGAGQLKDGISRFDEEGVSKLVETKEDKLDKVSDRIEILRQAAQNYTDETLKDGSSEGVKYLYRLDGVE